MRHGLATEKRNALRKLAIESLGGACQICGYEKCSEALDFHHTNALEKDFNISSKLSSWKRIASELKKCVLLCARCHREVHAGYHGLKYFDDESIGRQDY